MSKDKHRSRDRRLALLRTMRDRGGRIYLHCEGGMAAKNPDLQRLAHEGLAIIARSPGVPKWSKTFAYFQGKHFHSTPMIRRSYAEITEAGRAMLKAAEE